MKCLSCNVLLAVTVAAAAGGGVGVTLMKLSLLVLSAVSSTVPSASTILMLCRVL